MRELAQQRMKWFLSGLEVPLSNLLLGIAAGSNDPITKSIHHCHCTASTSALHNHTSLFQMALSVLCKGFSGVAWPGAIGQSAKAMTGLTELPHWVATKCTILHTSPINTPYSLSGRAGFNNQINPTPKTLVFLLRYGFLVTANSL